MQKLLEELFLRYYRDVFRYLYGLSHDVSLSEELASEVFLEVVKSIVLFRGEADIRTWIFSIARHRWLRYLRRKDRELPGEELAEWLADPGKMPEEWYADRETAEKIFRILDGEPERTKKIVLMRAEGYSFREISMELGISEGSARVIDFRARTKIRSILEKEGYGCE